jgi:hypothetical protein
MKKLLKSVKAYLSCLIDPKLVPTGLKVAVVVGSLLFAINHGAAVLRHEMTFERWLAVSLTYLMPYLVNIHGQYVVRSRSQQTH